MRRLYPASNLAMKLRLPRYLVKSLSLPALLSLICVACAGQSATFATNPTRFFVCDKGTGGYSGTLPQGSGTPGVTVSVSAAKQKNGFAVRACQATLNWYDQQLVVAPEVAQADIDVMGADLGLGSLVVAFQIKATEDDPHIKYEIYSLNRPPQLLRTITGEDYFSAADTRLDGSVEIWTTDAGAVNGFESLPRSAFDVAPTVVLRFEDNKLMDVSSEFGPHFDAQIKLLRSQLDAQQLSDFKQSDGKLASHIPSAKAAPDALLAIKVKVLEIVWCYLYSGREQEAWDALTAMWPAADLDRIRAAIVVAQAHGLRSQVDGVSHQGPPQQKKHPFVFRHIPPTGSNVPAEVREWLADTIPERLVWMAAPPHNPEHWDEHREMQLVIDEAGKVRSVKVSGGHQKDESNQDWIDSSAGWKYIPAYKDHHPIAFHWKTYVRRNR
jgi:hypothetical protein